MAKNAARDAAKTPARVPAKEAAKKPVKDAVKKPVKDAAKPVKDTAKPAKGTAHDAVKPAVKKPVKEPAHEPVKAAVKKPVKETPKKPAKDSEAEDNAAEGADSVDEGLRLIQSKPEGILQSELWKELGVDSRKCSRIVKKLEESGLIERIDFKREGIKTYLLRARQQPVNPAHLLAGDELIPCVSCELECVVEECHPLMDWMYQLAIVEHTEE